MTDDEDTEVHRCPRGRYCAGAERLPLEDGPVWLPAEVTVEHQMCGRCRRELREALRALPLDVAELTTRFVPSMAVRYRDPDMPDSPRGKKHPPLPLDGSAEALRALIDHEVTSWSESVAELAGIEWSTYWAEHSRIGSRVELGCELLDANVDWLLGLPETTHRCRSAGEHPTDGHDLDHVTYDGTDYWITRTGTDAALLLLHLHAQVERFVGRPPMDRCPVPCPRCHRQALYRVHQRGYVVSGTRRPGSPGHVICRSCWNRWSDDEYEQLQDATTLLFGVRL